jgi:hypothetical protein
MAGGPISQSDKASLVYLVQGGADPNLWVMAVSRSPDEDRRI